MRTKPCEDEPLRKQERCKNKSIARMKALQEQMHCKKESIAREQNIARGVVRSVVRSVARSVARMRAKGYENH